MHNIDKRITLSFFTTSISQPTVTSLYKGILEECKERNFNLITVNGERLKEEHNYHYNCNILYDFINKSNTDAIISWASALGTYLTDEELKAFHDKFNGIPIVTLGKKIEGYPAIIIDNYFSMKQMVLHLINDHKYKNIGFIRGPANYFYADERLRGYKDAFKESNLPINELLITQPALFVSKTGKAAIHYFLDELRLKPKWELDAIVAVSDEIAIVAMNELQARGIKVPEEIAIVGFNNNINCRSVIPALSSIEIHFDELGKTAVRNCYKLIKGEKVDELTVIKTDLCIRESCGCKRESQVIEKFSISEEEQFINELREKKSILIDEMYRKLSIFLDNQDIKEISETIVEKLISDLNDRNKDIFITFFKNFLIKNSDFDFDFFRWEDLITTIFNFLNKLQSLKCEDALYLNKLVHQSRVCIQHAKRYFFVQYKIKNEKTTFDTLMGSQMISSSVKGRGLKKVLKKVFLMLGIDEVYIFTYKNGNVKEIELFLHYKNGKILNNIKNNEWIPLEILLRKERMDLLLMSLYFKERNIGYIIFKCSNSIDNKIFTLLRGQISSTIESIITLSLLKEAHRKQTSLYEEIKRKNIELDKTTKELWGEMELAKKLQITIIPKKVELEGYDIATKLIPTENIRGGYYDIIDVHKNNNTYWLNIGDVTGSGVIVGLILMMIHLINVNFIMNYPEITPVELLKKVNLVLYHFLKDRLKIDNFLTSCYMKFDREGNFIYSGLHEKILIYRSQYGIVEEIETTGIPVGVIFDISYYVSQNYFKLEKDDVLLLFTKGLWMIKKGEREVLLKRLEEIFKNVAFETADKIVLAILAEVYDMNETLSDDIAVVVLKKL